MGLNPDRTIADCDEVVVFGSQAGGCSTESSDLDVLLVGSSLRCLSTRIDVVSVSREQLEDPRWLSSELASHIAEYGVWIKGSGFWRNDVSISNGQAADRKLSRIVARARAILKSPPTRPRIAQSVRRKLILEYARWNGLNKGQAVPPTALLTANIVNFQNECSVSNDIPVDLLAALERLNVTLRNNGVGCTRTQAATTVPYEAVT